VDHEVLLIDRWDMVGLLRDLTTRGQHPGVIAFAEDGVASWDSKSVGDKAFRLARGLQVVERFVATGRRPIELPVLRVPEVCEGTGNRNG
jgi:hypothetical protein